MVNRAAEPPCFFNLKFGNDIQFMGKFPVRGVHWLLYE
jgi:hypothetical protein